MVSTWLTGPLLVCAVLSVSLTNSAHSLVLALVTQSVSGSSQCTVLPYATMLTHMLGLCLDSPSSHHAQLILALKLEVSN